MFPGSTDPKKLARYLALSQVGLEMVVPIALGAVLDHYLNWSPWGVVIGVILGLVGGLAHLVQLTRQDREGQAQPADKQPPESG
jgi:F0F1-type ATP synthase assembly protein I